MVVMDVSVSSTSQALSPKTSLCHHNTSAPPQGHIGPIPKVEVRLLEPEGKEKARVCAYEPSPRVSEEGKPKMEGTASV